MRKSLFGILVLALFAPAGTGAIAQDRIEEHWIAPQASQAGEVGFGFDDREDYFFIPALRAVVYKNGIATGPLCKSASDPLCANSEYFTIKAMLVPCTNRSEKNCIDAVFARGNNGKNVRGIFKDFVTKDDKYYWSGDSAKNIPDSKVETIWTFPGITHPGGSDFLVSVLLDGTYEEGKQPFWERVVTMLQPVSTVLDGTARRAYSLPNERLDDFFPEEAIKQRFTFNGAQVGTIHKNCAATTDGVCFKREQFPSNTSFAVSIRTSSKVSGWIHGRMRGPQVVVRNAGDYWITAVNGSPTEVPVVAQWIAKNQLTESLQSEFRNAPLTFVTAGDGGLAQRYSTAGDFNKVTLQRFNLVLPFAKDTASATPKIWAFGSVRPRDLLRDADALGGKKECLTKTDGLAGVVTTNATVYDGSIPAFNAAEQTLDYLVSAPHFAANGREFGGTYDLIMRADVAKCIYGFDRTPASATISVLSEDGVERLTTVNLLERRGWLIFAAYGFNFSSPKIKIKLSQSAVPGAKDSAEHLVEEDFLEVKEEAMTPAQSSETAQSSPVVKPAARKPTTKTVTCSKGKSIRKISGISPKCPKGYKLVK